MRRPGPPDLRWEAMAGYILGASTAGLLVLMFCHF